MGTLCLYHVYYIDCMYIVCKYSPMGFIMGMFNHQVYTLYGNITWLVWYGGKYNTLYMNTILGNMMLILRLLYGNILGNLYNDTNTSPSWIGNLMGLCHEQLVYIHGLICLKQVGISWAFGNCRILWHSMS